MSFSRRGGRLSDRQQAVWDETAATLILEVPREHISTSVEAGYVFDAATAFGRSAPLVVEIGTGRGDALVHAAVEHPELNFLGFEVYRPGIAQTLVMRQEAGVTNVRMMIVNAAEAVSTMLPAGSVHELRVWFPDPWRTARHHKRRLIDAEFATLAARVLEPGGVWRLATDWEDYAEQMRVALTEAPDFEGGEWGERFEGRPMTHFERRGLAAGRPVRDLTAVRRTP